jgi:lytic murein transglycosylase
MQLRVCGILRLATVIALMAMPASARADQVFLGWLETLRPEATAAGVSEATFNSAFRGMEPDLTIPDLDLPGRDKTGSAGQAEFTRPPSEYLDKAYMGRLSATGKQLEAKHRAALESIERDSGVDRYSLLAIWGRETSYGNYTLPKDAVRMLATLAYVGRRKDLFRKELIAALGMLESGVARSDMKSSWAGAVGLTQFMPSEYAPFARDIDGDGKKDIFRSVPDALGSAAAQLSGKGWVAGLPWGFEVRIPAQSDCSLEGPLQARPLSDWIAAGFVRAGGQAWPQNLMTNAMYLMSPAGGNGPAFLVTDNFKVIRQYNTSDLYALFVGHLADRIAGGLDFEAPWGTAVQRTKTIEDIQVRLKALGYTVDKIDGKVGSNSRMNIGKYQKANGLKVDCWPTDGVLAHMRANAAQ